MQQLRHHQCRWLQQEPVRGGDLRCQAIPSLAEVSDPRSHSESGLRRCPARTDHDPEWLARCQLRSGRVSCPHGLCQATIRNAKPHIPPPHPSSRRAQSVRPPTRAKRHGPMPQRYRCFCVILIISIEFHRSRRQMTVNITWTFHSQADARPVRRPVASAVPAGHRRASAKPRGSTQTSAQIGCVTASSCWPPGSP